MNAWLHGGLRGRVSSTGRCARIWITRAETASYQRLARATRLKGLGPQEPGRRSARRPTVLPAIAGGRYVGLAFPVSHVYLGGGVLAS